jgi:hypothetical protein
MAFPLTSATVDMWFANGLYTSTITNLLSCGRSTSGYAQNANGTLTNFGANTLRIGVGTGLLVEEARTNEMLQSADLTSGTWTKSATTITVGGTALDGTATADLVVPNNTNTQHRIIQSVSVTLGQNTMFTAYAKAGGYSKVGMRESTTSGAEVSWDLVSGTVMFVSGGNTADIQDCKNGWFRLIWSFAPIGTGAVNFNFYVMDNGYTGGTFDTYAFAGNTTSGVFIWGVQQENNVSFATSYIPTTTVPVLRDADRVSCIGTADTVLRGSAVSVLVWAGPTPNANVAGVNANLLGSTPSLLHIPGYETSSGSNHVLQFNLILSLAVTPGAGSIYTTASMKSATCWDANGRSIAAAGAVTSDNQATPTDTTYWLGADSADDDLDGYLQRVTLWNVRLTDSSLQNLTQDIIMLPTHTETWRQTRAIGY